MGAPCTFNVPGTVVRVVKSIAETAENVPVNFDIRVDCETADSVEFRPNYDIVTFPTLGNPTKPTEAIPVRATSKPAKCVRDLADAEYSSYLHHHRHHRHLKVK